VNIFEGIVLTEAIVVSRPNLIVRLLQQILEVLRISQHLAGLFDLTSSVYVAGYLLLGKKKAPNLFGFVVLS